MKINEQQSGAYRAPLAGPPTSVFGKLLTIAAGVLILVVAFMFSILALGVVLVVGVLIFAYLKWKTRHLPQELRNLHQRMQEQAGRQGGYQPPPESGRVIEGEVISDAEYQASTAPEQASHDGQGRAARRPSTPYTPDQP
ncbi:MAG: hypothetical protein AW10_00743 [Candidatus Accumulibacter appositus]|uniref:Transmembrane protein n=1 Tax=Candidatus Accumulibacter appositus TaxID=1454003 RepID=A0A011PZH6_9PROT|nr:hypothetical protein [Accumulibacter sp.]EXI82295.1 MAG: hypothetical protein AW10_00743 [Candidatus Accumulibacter appositus]HRF06068.1 hypothetical protein [Accumulibacter sp.]